VPRHTAPADPSASIGVGLFLDLDQTSYKVLGFTGMWQTASLPSLADLIQNKPVTKVHIAVTKTFQTLVTAEPVVIVGSKKIMSAVILLSVEKQSLVTALSC